MNPGVEYVFQVVVLMEAGLGASASVRLTPRNPDEVAEYGLCKQLVFMDDFGHSPLLLFLSGSVIYYFLRISDRVK